MYKKTISININSSAGCTQNFLLYRYTVVFKILTDPDGWTEQALGILGKCSRTHPAISV